MSTGSGLPPNTLTDADIAKAARAIEAIAQEAGPLRSRATQLLKITNDASAMVTTLIALMNDRNEDIDDRRWALDRLAEIAGYWDQA